MRTWNLVQDDRGRFVKACRACDVRLPKDWEDHLCHDCWASDLYCEECGGQLDGDTAVIEGYARGCVCPREPSFWELDETRPEALPEITARAVSIDGQIHLRIYQGADLKHIGTMTANRALLLAYDLIGLALAMRQRAREIGGDPLLLEAPLERDVAGIAAHAHQNGDRCADHQTQGD
jgi:hypothetical protein